MATRRKLTAKEIADLDLYRKQRQKFQAKLGAAKRDNIEWNLKFNDVIWPSHCPILDLKLDYFTETIIDESPSFDRIDNTEGYIRGNIMIISMKANRIKNSGNINDLEKILDYMQKNLTKTNECVTLLK